jgi:hypothetical protein
MDSVFEQLEIACGSCGARVVVEPLHRTARCPYCDSPSVVDRPLTEDRPDPTWVVGFAVDRRQATVRMRRYLASKRWAPFGLKDRTADKVCGVYLPTYLYSTTAASSFNATISEAYEKVGVTSDSDGVRVGKKRRIEHRQLSGAHTSYLGDVVVTASRGVSNDEVEAIEPYDLSGLRRYTPAMISGWMAEEPSLPRDRCLGLARREARAAVSGLLRRFMPGDDHSDLRHTTALHEEALELALLPVWVFAIRHHETRPPIRILVNGQTGATGGTTPISWAKIALVAGGVLSLLALSGLIGVVVEMLR